MQKNIQKIAVIGGSGFIGSRFINHYNRIIDFYIIDKDINGEYKNQSIKLDIRNKESLIGELKNADLVIHLAAEHRDDVSPVSLYYDVNVEGTRNILHAMDKNGIYNIIFTSSVAIYGLNKDNPDETHAPDPVNHYGKSKWQAEEILRDWYFKKPDERNLTIIRPTVVFGENNRGNVYNLLKQIASGRFIMIGRGLNKKSIAYVGNVAAFLKFCCDNIKQYQVFNYIDKPDLNINQLVNQVEKSLGRKIPSIRLPYWLGLAGGYGFDFLGLILRKKFSISAIRIKKFCAVTQFDSNKASSVGFQRLFTIEKGLDLTLKNEFGIKK